ncbi:hypothetical protein GW17_00062074 [Ensete ventricosum]|nr:hypothetical protein GW17_00062074 [Ensete ventricosum]
MLNLDIIHGIPRVGRGRFGFIATATTPSSLEVEEVQAETMAKKGVEASSKRPTEGVMCLRKKVKVSSNRHKSRHEEEGSKSHASKSNEQVGVIVLIDRVLKTMMLSQHYCMALADRVFNASRVINVRDNKVEGLRMEVAELKVGSELEAVAAIKLRAFEVQALTDHLKVELEEVSHRRESLELDMDNSHLFLADSQEQLKDVLARR